MIYAGYRSILSEVDNGKPSHSRLSRRMASEPGSESEILVQRLLDLANDIQELEVDLIVCSSRRSTRITEKTPRLIQTLNRIKSSLGLCRSRPDQRHSFANFGISG